MLMTWLKRFHMVPRMGSGCSRENLRMDVEVVVSHDIFYLVKKRELFLFTLDPNPC